MTSGRIKGSVGMKLITYSLILEDTVSGESRKDFREDFTRRLGEEYKSDVASQSHATWGSPALLGVPHIS